MEFTQEQARDIHLHQLLLRQRNRISDPVEIIKSMGYVQLDSIFVTARSHDLVLHTRSDTYQREEVWKYQEDGLIFEEFAHARSLIHIDEFPYYYRLMLSRRNKKVKTPKGVDNVEKLMKEVLRQIEAAGEVTTRDIEITSNYQTRWSSLVKWVLDVLIRRGYIQIKRRENFSTIYYSLIEETRAELPDEDDLPNRMEVFWHHIFQTLDIHGLVPLHRLLYYMYLQKRFTFKGKTQSPRKLVKDAINEGRITEHTVKGTDTHFYSRPGFGDEYQLPQFENKTVFLLSPFDNALWSREALEDQYQFRYKFEAYTPKKDRKYGLFALPILYGNEFVGRVDPKFDRDSNQMRLRQWTWEENFKPLSNFWDELAITVDRLAKFHQSETISFGNLNKEMQRELQDRISL